MKLRNYISYAGTFLIITKGNINNISISKLAVFWGISSAFYCYLESLKHVQPTDASVLSSAEPLSAVLLSVLWLNASLGIAQWIGTICIITTIIILSFVKNK
jgi:drug/metabolite transporter (DMT)-like permease